MARTHWSFRLVKLAAVVGAVFAGSSMMGAGGCPGGDVNDPPAGGGNPPPGQQPDGSGPAEKRQEDKDR